MKPTTTRPPFLLAALVLPIVLLSGVAATAKLPPPSDEAKAKAAETAAKAAWSGKVAIYELCRSQDRIASAYLAGASAAASVGTVAQTAASTAASASAAAAWKAEAMPLGAAPASAASPAMAAGSSASAGTTVAAIVPPLSTPSTAQPVPTPDCSDPGAFVYNADNAVPPPLESAGAHSPARTAAQPPQSATLSADQNPAPKTK